jgi:hypothetical protein
MRYDFNYQQSAGRRGAPRGRGRGQPAPEERTSSEQRQRIRAWFTGRLPEEWFTEAPAVHVDNDEILVVGALRPVELAGDASADERSTAELARIGGFREDTREQRMRIADEAQAAFGRQVSWGASSGGTTHLFTTAAVPVMTRLRIGERGVLDTLIDAGVARSRSEALAWCVRLVGKNEDAWINELREAFDNVETVRARGPRSGDQPD